jgi:hypothetical protein
MHSYNKYGLFVIALAGIAGTTFAAPVKKSDLQAQLTDGLALQDLLPAYDQTATLVGTSVEFITEENALEGK